MKERNFYWDAVKGVSIGAVLMIHSNLPSENEIFPVLMRHFFTFAVALFFFCNGYFSIRSKSSPFRMIAVRLLPPYILWSLPFFAYSQFVSHSYELNCSRMIDVVFLGGSYPILYFISVLIQLKLLDRLIRFLWNKKSGVIDSLLLCVTPLYSAFIYVLFFSMENPPGNLHKIFLAWFSFYYLGMIMERYAFTIKPLHSVILVAGALYISLLEAFGLAVHKQMYLAVTQLSFGSQIFSIAVILCLWSLREPDYKSSALSQVGRFCFGIFLFHIPVMRFVEFLMRQLTIQNLPFGGGQLILWALTLSSSFCICWILNYFLPEKYVSILGVK